MKRKTKNKEAAHLQKKIELYESFLYRYLPQITSLSHVTRLNLFDLFGSTGLDRLGSQGTPFTIFNALAKQRQHQHKKKGSLKPFSLSLVSLLPQNTFLKAVEQLQQENMQSSTCRLDSWTASSFSEGLKKLVRQIRQQVASEKNLLFVDPLSISGFLPQDLKLLPDRKAEAILFLPLKTLWLLHTKPEKAQASEEMSALKQSLDKLFPEGHRYWSEEIEPPEFFQFMKDAFQLDGLFYTALEPAPENNELPEGVLLALSSDAYMMEKFLYSLQALRPTHTTPPGEQLFLFGSGNTPEPAVPDSHSIFNLLQEEMDNQQLYKAALQAGILPSKLLEELNAVIGEGRVEVLDAKRKPLASAPPASIGYTAFKAPEPICFFRRKG